MAAPGRRRLILVAMWLLFAPATIYSLATAIQLGATAARWVAEHQPADQQAIVLDGGGTVLLRSPIEPQTHPSLLTRLATLTVGLLLVLGLAAIYVAVLSRTTRTYLRARRESAPTPSAAH
jgi:hypothetical protein